MKHFFILLLFGSYAVPAIAQVPSGEFNYAFTNTALWDFSGIYTNNTVTNDVVIAEFQLAANGQITGTRSEVYDDGTDSAEGSAFISGRVFDKPTVGFRDSWKGTYSGVSGGVSYVANASVHGTIVLAPSTLMVTDDASGRICVVGGRCTSLNEAFDLPLPAGMNGDWTLDIDITADGDKLTGTGTLTLSNGRALSYEISGSYNTKTELAKLKLVGSGDATGTSLSLTTQGTGMNLTTLKGKVLGQTPAFP